jgi:hypothetical protein
VAVSDAAASQQGQDLGDKAQDAAQKAANSRWVDRVARAGLIARAVIYLMVAASLVVGPQSGQASAAGAHRQETELTARVLGWPFGQLLVGTVGAVLVASGVGFGYQAVTTNFQDRLKQQQMRPAVRRAATVLGAIGSLSRAVTLVLVGVFVVSAAVTFNPRKARGLDASLRAIADQPYGPYLLAAVALGLACYGVYVLLEVRYRKV